MRKNFHHSSMSAFFLIIGCLVLCFSANIESFREREEDIWTAYGVRFLNCEYVSYENINEDVIIRLINTPLLKETYIQLGMEKSVARLYAFSDCFSVQQYRKDAKGNISLYKVNDVPCADIDSEFYSPLLSGEGFKRGYRLYTDFGTYEIS